VNATFPKLRWPFDRAQFDALQKWIDQMRDVFNRNITFSGNLACDVVTFDFASGATPSKRIANTSRPLGVVPFDLRKIEPASNAAVSIADGFSWTFDPSTQTLTFPSFGTIAAGAKYRATVLVVRS
jgi:hypothetical protein